MVLVTGAAGFFGIHAVKLLVEAGQDVVALGTSGFPEGAREYFGQEGVRKVSFETCDISDPDASSSARISPALWRLPLCAIAIRPYGVVAANGCRFRLRPSGTVE